MKYIVIETSRQGYRVHYDPYRGLRLFVPYGTDDATARAFLLRHKRWIAARARQYRDFPAPRMCEGEPWLVFGAFKTLIYRGESDVMRLEGDALVLPEKTRGDCAAAVDLAREYYESLTRAVVLPRAKTLSEKTGLSCTALSIERKKTAFGYCDADNRVCFHAQTSLLPPRLIDYLIVHELCHTVRHDHSREFSKCMERFYPEGRAAEKELKRYSHLFGLFQRDFVSLVQSADRDLPDGARSGTIAIGGSAGISAL